MADRISQSVAKRVALKAYLSSDHLSPATGKTIAVVISKNGAAFGNPNAGSTNATEIGNGWYYVDMDTTDTGTVGPLIVRGTEGTIDPTEIDFSVEVAIPANVTLFGGTAGTFAAGVAEVKVASLATGALTAINGEVVDALNVDTYAQPGSGAPPATTTLVRKIGDLHKSLINKQIMDRTTGEVRLYDSTGATVHAKAVVTNDAVTQQTTKGAMVSG